MRVVRVGLPALVGCLVLLFGMQAVASGLQSGDGAALADNLHTAAIPLAIGVVLLLASVALARRTHFGFLLGLAVGVLMTIAGLGTIVLEIPFLQEGGLSAAIGGGVIIVATVWSLVWLLYTWRLSKAGGTFAPAWTAADRRLGIVVSVVIVVAAGAFLGTGALQATAVANSIENDAQARAVVEATTIRVRVLDTAIAPAAGGSPAVVDSLTIEIELRSERAYPLGAAPTLCLTSFAMFLDPAYKHGMLCWGLPGPEDSLRSAFKTPAIPKDTTKVQLQLRGAGSPCPFSPGAWYADLTLAPVAGGDGSGSVPGLYSIGTTFTVGDDSVPPPPSGTPDASEGCLGVSP